MVTITSDELRCKLADIVYNSRDNSFDSAELYCFALAQLLAGVFIKLGGINKYQKELNCLTNPNIPADIQNICRRSLRFLGKVLKAYEIDNEKLKKVYGMLTEHRDGYLDGGIDENLCEEAFYSGLYSDNIFLRE